MGHSKIHDGAAGEGGAAGVVSAVDDRQDEYARLVSQLDHAKNQRAKEQRKVSELEQNVSLLIQVKTIILFVTVDRLSAPEKLTKRRFGEQMVDLFTEHFRRCADYRIDPRRKRFSF